MAVAAKISVASAAPTRPNMLRENWATVSPLSAAAPEITLLISP